MAVLPGGGPPQSHHQRVKELFLAALDQPRGRRASYLASACGGDEALRREVLELFLLHGEQDSVLDTPLDGMEALADLSVPMEGMVGPYRLVRVLGRGGMGVVHLAEFDGASVAVKLLAAGAVSPEVRERFRLEAEILGRLQHPGIARVLATGEMPGPAGVPQPWIAMEYVEGRPLREYADGAGPDLEGRVALLAAVCDVVQYAHSHGIVHRDLKPSNILVRANGQPVVLDFGVARLLVGDERPTELATRTGQLVGTPQYMSPEQVQAEPAGIGPASDVYSLGIIAYQLLSGRVPYEASSVSLARAIVSILTLDPPLLGCESPRLRGPLERIVAMALEKQPQQRYPDAGALSDDLRRWLEGHSIRAHGPGLVRSIQRWSRSRRRLVAGSFGVLLSALVFAAWLLGTGRAMPRERVLATYREAETLTMQAIPLLYEGERSAARLQQSIALYARARSLLGQVPRLRHHDLLLRRIEKDLGTAQFLLGELTWDTTPYRTAIMTLRHARGIPGDLVRDWRADMQVPELGDLHVPNADLLGLMCAAELGVHRLWGEWASIASANTFSHACLQEHLERIAAARAGAAADAAAAEAAASADRNMLGYCYNSLAEVTTDLARYRWDGETARAATVYSDSAMALQGSFAQHWPALGSLLYERGRAFRTLGEITGSAAAFDSARFYFEACSDFRGPSRPWVFAQTCAEQALLGLALARRPGRRERRLALLAGARADVDSALVVLRPAGIAPPALASLRSLDAELLTELARIERQPSLLDSAEARIAESSEQFPVTALPRPAALDWIRRSLIARARYELTADPRALEVSLAALNRASVIAGPRGDSLVSTRVERERRAVNELRPANAGR